MSAAAPPVEGERAAHVDAAADPPTGDAAEALLRRLASAYEDVHREAYKDEVVHGAALSQEQLKDGMLRSWPN